MWLWLDRFRTGGSAAKQRGGVCGGGAEWVFAWRSQCYSVRAWGPVAPLPGVLLEENHETEDTFLGGELAARERAASGHRSP